MTFLTSYYYRCQEASDSTVRGPPRERTAARTVESLGGEVESFFFTVTGDYDGMLIYSLPFNHDVKTFDLVAKASGAFKSMRTTKLISSDDMLGCAHQAQEVCSHLIPKAAGGEVNGHDIVSKPMPGVGTRVQGANGFPYPGAQ